MALGVSLLDRVDSSINLCFREKKPPSLVVAAILSPSISWTGGSESICLWSLSSLLDSSDFMSKFYRSSSTYTNLPAFFITLLTLYMSLLSWFNSGSICNLPSWIQTKLVIRSSKSPWQILSIYFNLLSVIVRLRTGLSVSIYCKISLAKLFLPYFDFFT